MKTAKSLEEETACYAELGRSCQSRGDLNGAEEMYHAALVIEETLERQEGIAVRCGDLGAVYGMRGDGDLEQAEVMYRKALGLFQDLEMDVQAEQIRCLLSKIRRQGGSE